MPVSQRVTFTSEGGIYEETTEVAATISGDIQDVLDTFERFLRGCGYHFDHVVVVNSRDHITIHPINREE